MAQLDIHDHSRNSAGYTYVYPVVSRRARGVSVGINLNPNNACNWACIYCQVPNLTRGSAPEINLPQLEQELRDFLRQVVRGDWLANNVPEDSRVLQDIAFSGNGEPTSAQEFPAAVALAGQMLRDFGLSQVKLRLITNGSLLNRETVQVAIRNMAGMNGEVWFKLDRASSEGMAQVNLINDNMVAVKKRLLAATENCTTWLQTCWFALDGMAPAAAERRAYLQLVSEVRDRIAGVHLYGLARQPMQPGSERLSSLAEAEMQAFAEEIRALGVVVTVNQ
jgi:wyosine [tRNA(Phe)-imidazoG37] synthetase (radical SAM superfamily)